MPLPQHRLLSRRWQNSGNRRLPRHRNQPHQHHHHQKKLRMIKLLQQRWRAEIMNAIYGDRSVRQGAIRYVVDLQPGYAFPSSDFVEEGIRLLRGANIAPGRLRWETDVVCVPPESRIALSEYESTEGDLVLGMDRPSIAEGNDALGAVT